MNPALTQQLQAAHDYDLRHRTTQHRPSRPPRRVFSIKLKLRVPPGVAPSARTA